MRFTPQICVLAVLIAVTVGFNIASFVNATDKQLVNDADKVYPVTYRITDLPVWSEDGEVFNPAILMAYLQTKLTAEAWTDTSVMRAYPQTKGLVVATTSANHNSIRALLDSLRADIGVQAK